MTLLPGLLNPEQWEAGSAATSCDPLCIPRQAVAQKAFPWEKYRFIIIVGTKGYSELGQKGRGRLYLADLFFFSLKSLLFVCRPFFAEKRIKKKKPPHMGEWDSGLACCGLENSIKSWTCRAGLQRLETGSACYASGEHPWGQLRLSPAIKGAGLGVSLPGGLPKAELGQ